MRLIAALAVVSAHLVAVPALAAVTAVTDNGCSVREAVHIAAAPGAVYAMLIQPAKWWNAEHTFSRDAANLTLDTRAGGCFCEKLPGGGSVSHLTVVMVSPGKALTLRGALGPFQGQGVDGALSWVLTPAGNQTDLVVTYNLGGYLIMPGGFPQWSKAIDAMLGEQVARLRQAVEGTDAGP
jgi:hypothetical protein